MSKTRGNLEPAVIKATDDSIAVKCMFNPEYYTIKKQNQYDQGKELVKPPKPEFKRYGRSTLTLSALYFDTYETGKDLTETTNDLWALMRPTDPNNAESKPPEVEFEWGKFSFKAFITDMTIKYTLFDKDGNPVRAEVTISFIQNEDPTRFPHQNPTSGSEKVQEVRKIIQGDRLDLIAADVYGDATQWRLIAEHNHILNPKALRPGQLLTIPPL